LLRARRINDFDTVDFITIEGINLDDIYIFLSETFEIEKNRFLYIYINDPRCRKRLFNLYRKSNDILCTLAHKEIEIRNLLKSKISFSSVFAGALSASPKLRGKGLGRYIFYDAWSSLPKQYHLCFGLMTVNHLYQRLHRRIGWRAKEPKRVLVYYKPADGHAPLRFFFSFSNYEIHRSKAKFLPILALDLIKMIPHLKFFFLKNSKGSEKFLIEKLEDIRLVPKISRFYDSYCSNQPYAYIARDESTWAHILSYKECFLIMNEKLNIVGYFVLYKDPDKIVVEEFFTNEKKAVCCLARSNRGESPK